MTEGGNCRRQVAGGQAMYQAMAVIAPCVSRLLKGDDAKRGKKRRQ